MKESEIIERLKECGLEDKEARTYLSLLMGGIAKASEVAKRAGFSRMDAYNSLKKLQNHGLVEATMEKPMKFVPRPVEEALGLLIKEKELEIQRIDDTKKTLGQYVKLSQVESEVEHRFRIIKERKNIQMQVESMVEAADHEVRLLVTQEALIRSKAAGLFNTLKKRQPAGLTVRVMTQINEPNLRQAKILAEDHDITHFEIPNFNLLVIDDREVLLSVSLDDRRGSSGTDDTALWMNSPDFIHAQRNFFEHLWDNGVPAADRITELETGLGLKPLKLELGHGSMYQRLRDIIEERERGKLPAGNDKEPFRYSLEDFGIDTTNMLRIVGNRIGREIANQMEAETLSDLWDEMGPLWEELKFGKLIVKEEDDGVTFTVQDAANCDTPEMMGTLLCQLDKGILEGVVGVKLGLECSLEKQCCRATGEKECRYEIRAKGADPSEPLAVQV